jgi:hypothetical protein
MISSQNDPPAAGHAHTQAVPPFVEAGSVADSPIGAPSPPTSSREPRMWIVWMILGGIVLGVAIAIAALIPMRALFAAEKAIGAGQAPREAAAAEAVSALADEQAAVDAVELYFQAWRTGDCDAYLATTAEAYRMGSDLLSCDSFLPAARVRAGLDDNHVVIIEGADADGRGTVTVLVTELHTSMYDEEGNPTDARGPYEDRYQFTVAALESGARITDSFAE